MLSLEELRGEIWPGREVRFCKLGGSVRGLSARMCLADLGQVGVPHVPWLAWVLQVGGLG